MGFSEVVKEKIKAGWLIFYFSDFSFITSLFLAWLIFVRGVIASENILICKLRVENAIPNISYR